MGSKGFWTAVLGLLFLGAGAAQAADYTIDPQHSSLNFKVKHLSISYVMGKFSKFSGSFQFDEKHAEKSKVTVTIDPSSVDTGEPARDNDLRSDHFFEVATYPTATYTSTRVTKIVDGKFKIIGNLTLHGVTKPVVLDATYDGAADDAQGHHVAFEATGEINRQDYGVDFNVTLDKGGVLVDDHVKLIFEIEGLQDAAKK
ncbi:MAG TPA: YceI family protein [bacterium]|nr:YceI family protein [bacterium]